MNRLKQLQLAVVYYQELFDYAERSFYTVENYQQLVEINTKLTSARLALYDYRYERGLLTSEMV